MKCKTSQLLHALTTIRMLVRHTTLASIISCIIAQAEAPADGWSNPVLAAKDTVLGPLSDAAKLVSAAYLDYSSLTASTTIQSFTSTEISTRGTKPFETYQKIIIECGVDPRNGTTLISSRTTSAQDQNGKLTVSIDKSPYLIKKIGRVNTKCEVRNPDGSLISRFEYIVEPTLINIHVDVSKYSTYSMKSPNRVFVQLSAAADVLSDCNAKNTTRDWFQLATVTPGVQKIVPFEGQNMMVTPWPGVQLGYMQAKK